MMQRIIKTLGAFAAIMSLSGFGSIERLFAPDADLWPRWEVSNSSSEQNIDHGKWNEILAGRVTLSRRGSNLVDYGAFTAAERQQLADYIADLSRIPISEFRRDEQLAYWINLYNALTVQVVLDHFPVDSIRDIKISPGLFSIGPWGKQLVTVEGHEISLNDIEHRILRPVWRDPRVHYAVNCASIGCPSLRPDAYTGDTMDARLDKAARDYVNDPRGVSIANGKISVSRIYDWFVDDFGGKEKTVLLHLQKFAEPDLSAQLKAIGRISGQHYDWSINNISR